VSITPYEPAENTVELFQRPRVDLARWAQDASDVHRMAQALASTQFVPANLRGKPDDVAAQILYGCDVNLPPMVALQQIHVIEGRPSLSALAMRGLAQANGIKFRIEEANSSRVVMYAMGPGDTGWTKSMWDLDRAKKLGLAGKSNWTKQPQAMLLARATSELCRLVAAPLFLGLAYSTEELADGAADIALPERAPEAEQEPVRLMKRAPAKKAAAKAGEPKPATVTATATVPSFDNGPLPEGQEAAIRATDPEKAVTAETRKALMLAFLDAKIEDRDTRLAYVDDVVGRSVGSINDVTDAEGRKIVDQLRADIAEQAERDGGEGSS
jgi:hypothetical protein